MLAAQELGAVRRDQVVFAQIGFSLAAGEALLVTGANGAGKSTLLRILAGLRRPEAGVVAWGGESIARDLGEHAERLAYLSHLDAVKPGLTVRENLAFAALAQGGDVEDALAAMGVGGLAEVPARLLSAGQKRRVALARTMLGERPLWLLDEPTNGLDAPAQGLLLEAIVRQLGRGGMVVVATHAALGLQGRELRLA